MNLSQRGKSYTQSLFAGLLCAFSSSQVFSGTMGTPLPCSSGKAYLSVFGGAGSSNDISLRQFGTAFFLESAGGPLAVNAFGSGNSGTVGLVGGQVGYQWPELLLNVNALSGITPAAELEGYYIGKSTFNGHDINNDTVRLDEHDFFVSYPVKTGVFLINAIANFNAATQARFHPYVGLGFGTAILSISNADSTQVSPPEVGVNHYNSSTRSSDTAFAGQFKVGLNIDLTEHLNIFGEYRWLYLSSTDYTFGSTVYPDHAATSSWQVRFGAQNYNMGALGIRYSV